MMDYGLNPCSGNKGESASPRLLKFPFDNTYARLPARFYSCLSPKAVQTPRLVKVNAELAKNLGLDPDELANPEGVEVLAGNRVPEAAEPIALAYAGHQFGHFVPQLGDGRAILLGEIVGHDGLRYDIQLKGSGPTPYSRRGDGRAALGPVLREYIVSEAMAALGVPTTRALACVTTGEHLMRDTILPGAVLTRVAASHIRVGTFEYFAAKRDIEGLRTLANYAIERHYPDAATAAQPYRAFLDAVVTRQAELVAQWMLIGFIHGVMNTDNTSISGETIDYGPCAFMDAYNPATVFSSIDRLGRYAFGNQPDMAQWNLARLAEALLPLLVADNGDQEAALASAQEGVAAFVERFDAFYQAGLGRKLGLSTSREGDLALAEELLARMAANGADFTLTFRRLCSAAENPQGDGSVRSLFADPEAYDSWAMVWHGRLREDDENPETRGDIMRAANPIYIPRNHLVEAAIEAAVSANDFIPFDELISILSKPYQDGPVVNHYASLPSPNDDNYRTFCGT